MADISKITTLDGTTYNLKDTTARSIASSAYTRPMYGLGTGDIAMRSLVPEARANRLWFLPADQIIIESTTDGGATWASANISDAVKTQLFSGTRPNITIPRINGARSTSCGMRVTFSAMKYNVPSGTGETEKYNYWNNTYVKSQERYTTLTEFWFWLGSNGDTFRVVVEAATGAKSTTWVKCFDTNDYSIGFTGWSGADWCRFGSKTFGGGTGQTGNYWNWRITFWSRYAEGKSDFQQTSTQSIYHIAGYGENWWGATNNLMKNDHLYSFDYQQNATFPAKVTATGGFSGALTGNVTGNVSGTAANVTGTVAIANGGTGKTTANDAANALLSGLPEWTADPTDNVYLLRQDTGGFNLFGRVKFSTVWNYISGKISSVLGLTASSYSGSAAKVNNHTVGTDVPANAVFTDTTYESKTAASGGTDVSLVTTGEKYTWNNKVDSVNGSTGAVTITVPTKTSDLTNDSNFITGMYIASYGSSTYAEVLAAYQANKVVYCRASSNTNPGTGNQLRMAFLAYVNNQTTPTEFEFQYYRSVSSHSDSQQGDQVFIYKLDKTAGWSVTTRNSFTKIVAGTGLSSSYSSGALTLSATGSSANLDTVAGDLADTYDATETYAVGDYCIKDYILYKCTTAITTAEAWTAAHWEQVKITDELGETTAEGVVRADIAQTFTVAEKQQARDNILAEDKKLQFTNIVVETTDFESDETYEGFPYRAAISLTGVTSSMYPDVVFDSYEATSGCYSPVSQSYNGGIYIYATEIPEYSISLPSIICWSRGIVPGSTGGMDVASEIQDLNDDVEDIRLKVASLTLSSANWTGTGPFTQTVSISGATITNNTVVDLRPDVTTMTQLINDGVASLFIVNNNGALVAYAIGEVPTTNLTVQCCISETTSVS